MKKLVFVLFLFSTLSLSADIWQKTDGPYNDATFSILFEIDGEMYAKSKKYLSDNVIYKLEDGEWVAKEDHFFTKLGRFRDFEQDDSYVVISADSGVYISTDYGSTWSEITNYKDNDRLSGFFINNKRLFAVQYPGGSFNRLMKSDDLGETWDYVTYGSKADTIKAQAFASNDKKVYISQTDWFDPDIGGYQEQALFVSENNGDSWIKKELNFNLTIMTTIGDYLIGVKEEDAMIVRSSDDGDSWEYDSSYKFSIKCFKNKGGVIYAGAEKGIFITSDSGKSWEYKTSMNEGKVEDIILREDIIYANNGSTGVFKSTNNGNNWAKSHILTGKLIVQGVKNYRDTLFVSGGQKGIQYSADKGDTWNVFSNNLDSLSYEFSYHFDKKDSVFVGILDVFEANFIVSKDNCRSWKEFDLYKKFTNQMLLKGQIVITDNYKIFFNTIDGIQYSSDYGENWNFLDNTVLDSLDDISDLIMHKGNIYACSNSEGILRSTDSGESWEQFLDISSGNFIPDISSYELVIKNNNYIIRAENKTNFAFYISNDGGNTWENLSIIDKELHSYILDLLVIENYFLATTRNGVIFSSDQGRNWEDITSNLEEKLEDKTYGVSQLEVIDDLIFLTSSDGLYKTSFDKLGIELGVKSVAETKPYIYTNKPYPLPAGNSVTTEIYWGANFNMEKADIGIYDVKGNRVEDDENIELNSQSRWPGNLTWDCSGVADGIYFIVIEYGQSSKSIPIIKNSSR